MDEKEAQLWCWVSQGLWQVSLFLLSILQVCFVDKVHILLVPVQDIKVIRVEAEAPHDV